MKLLKQLLCKHKYYAKDLSKPLVAEVECIYCGKTKGVMKEDYYGSTKIKFSFR